MSQKELVNSGQIDIENVISMLHVNEVNSENILVSNIL